MECNRRHLFIFLALACLVVGCLYLGVYKEREFDEYRLFVKHRPCSCLYFHSPVGESDLSLSDLKGSDYQREMLFREFVENGGGWKRSILLPIP